MPAKDFKFISPGVFINEIDNSQLLEAPGDVGPAIIGRAQQGPGLIPTKVTSFADFVQKFGAPIPGKTNDDIARNGNTVGTTYGAYAAQAWLRNNSPITYVRLVGRQHTDATSGGKAGWKTTYLDPSTPSAAGGAYGLWVWQSGSVTTNSASLGAIFYVNTGSVALSGTAVSGNATTGGWATAVQRPNRIATNSLIRATGIGEFKLVISTGSMTTAIETKFNFTSTSDNFIRKVFNTNPTVTNSTITSTDEASYAGYWLGESYEDKISQEVLTGASATDQYAVIIPIFQGAGGANSGADLQRSFSNAKTGYFISQDLSTTTGSYDGADMQKLFRLVGRNTGRWASSNIKISIRDIKASTDDATQYGNFTIIVRAMSDTDSRPKILEQFNNCNLNPNSENYVARKIGNRYLTWSDEDRKYTELGDYANRSDYVYVDMVEAIDEGKTNPEYLPFGFIGLPRFKTFHSTTITTVNDFVTGGYDFYTGVHFAADAASDGVVLSGSTPVGAANKIGPNGVTFEFPALSLRASASAGNPTNPRDVYFGTDTSFNRSRASKTIGDYTGPKPEAIDMWVAQSDNPQTSASLVFSLDDMCNTSTSTTMSGTNVYISGSRQAATGSTIFAQTKAGPLTYMNSASYQTCLNAGANQFTTTLHGGFDGLNVTEAEPFRNTYTDDATELGNYAFNSLKVAIDALRDPEVVEYDLLAAPGITNNTLNRTMIEMCEERGDAMAIVDLKGGYVPETENTTSIANRLGSVTSTINNKKNDLVINSSWGAAYYPWVQIQDTINGALIWAPPSIAAIGAMSNGQSMQALWFAPAGFTRGGLSQGAAGLPVVNVRERLTSKDRDKLYEANINPIAQFPAEGIVIFGQKTLQVTPSALDRINVRRLLIFLKRQISRIAATLLFDQNVQSTWNRFKGRVGPLLQGVKAGLGLQDYRLILDETTTTPDLIDRNIMYAKIFLKPTRAVEFIAIDFVITDSGAAFED